MLPSSQYWLKTENGYENIYGNYKISNCKLFENGIYSKTIPVKLLEIEIGKQNLYYSLLHDIPTTTVGPYLFKVFRNQYVNIYYNNEIWLEGKDKWLHVVYATEEAEVTVRNLLERSYNFI